MTPSAKDEVAEEGADEERVNGEAREGRTNGGAEASCGIEGGSLYLPAWK